MNIQFAYLAILLLRAAAKAQIDSLVTTAYSSTNPSNKENGDSRYTVPKIYKMSVYSEISNRFAKTIITSNVKNVAEYAQEATFAVVLPESAYIAGFTMEIKNKNYTAYVEEKKQAKATYDQAVASGLAAAHVTISARDSNRITVSVNIEPASKATFYLTYEELLKRENGYEIVINIHPNQPVPQLEVQVDIKESSPIKYVKTPPIRSGNDIRKSEGDLDSRANINKINDTFSTVTFNPNEERQKQLAHALGTKENDGLAGQFVVQYDVKRDADGGEILLKDGYFVHFFSPEEVKLLPKYVIFVLDTSGSMFRRKIEQLKEAMNRILSELKPDDVFSLIDFNTVVTVWNVLERSSSTKYGLTQFRHHSQPRVSYKSMNFPEAFASSGENIENAKKIINSFDPTGSTNIYDALNIAVHLYDLQKKSFEEFNKQPLIVFLTDGEPTIVEINTNRIVSEISEKNKHSVPIFSLSFGDGADRNFLRNLSLSNFAFSRHIYEAADASLQLEDFYQQISSPLLNNVKFKYTQDAKDVTKTVYPVFFKGSEYIVAGRTDKNFNNQEPPHVDALGIHGPIVLKPTIKRPIGELERLWAYLTIQQLLEAKETARNAKEYEKKALDLALTYAFVTPITSLVVVKPGKSTSVDTQVAASASSAKSYSNPTNAYPAAAVGSIPISTARRRGSVTFGKQSRNSLSPTAIIREMLEARFRWISSIMHGNEIFIKGEPYKMGFNETVDETTPCSNSPNQRDGRCKLLYNCDYIKIFNVLPTIYKYYEHFCHIGQYAGVCCPI